MNKFLIKKPFFIVILIEIYGKKKFFFMRKYKLIFFSKINKSLLNNHDEINTFFIVICYCNKYD